MFKMLVLHILLRSCMLFPLSVTVTQPMVGVGFFQYEYGEFQE